LNREEKKMRTDKELDFLESHIPNLANSATQQAYLDTLSHGYSVVEVRDARIVEVFADGTEILIKTIEDEIVVKEKIITK